MSNPITYKELHDAVEIVNQGLKTHLLTTKVVPGEGGFNNWVSEVQMQDKVYIEVLREQTCLRYDGLNIIIHTVVLADKGCDGYWKYISVKPLNNKARDTFVVVDGDIVKTFDVGTCKLFMANENGQYNEIDCRKVQNDYAACAMMLEEYLHADIDIDKEF